MHHLLTLVLTIGLLNFPGNLPAEPSGNVSEVTRGLMCTCGCTMVLYSCQCGTADEMQEEIREMLNVGLSKEDILARYVDQYGKTMLAAPPKEGFHLSAWIVPFAALGGAVIVVVLLLRRRGTHGGEYTLSEDSMDPDYLEEVERELKAIEDDDV